jgi:alkylation response protein AidB-like acyl-CoA dehydrogenase
MDFGLTDDQRDIQRTARDMLSERCSPERVREHAQDRRSDSELWRGLSELGWPGIAIAESYGGQGLGQIELSILCEELGRVLAPVPFLPSVMAAAVIGQAGSDDQRERWLPGLASGEIAGALGLSAGGVAELVIGAPEAGVIVLLDGHTRARDARARVCAASDVEVTGVDSIDPTRATATVSAPPGAGEELPGDPSPGVDRALICISSELVGVCDRALAMTVAYVSERRQFGVPVGSYQAVSHRCAQMLLDTEKARSTAAAAAWSAASDPEGLAEAAAMSKACASQGGCDVTASAIQAHGGIGFTWEADVHWLYKRAHLDAALLGGAKHQRARLARILAARSRGDHSLNGAAAQGVREPAA